MNSSILKKTLKTSNELDHLTQNLQTDSLNKINSITIAPSSLTNQELIQMIERWDVYFRIDQKFDIWKFQFPKGRVKNIPNQFYNLLIHYFCLKKLQILLKDYHQNFSVQVSFKIKEIYKKLSLSGKLKGDKFNCLLLIAVKIISYFIGSHTSEVDTDFKLQTQIFIILNYVILGAQVSSKTYKIILDHHIKKIASKNPRVSVFMRSLVKNKSNVFKQNYEKTSHSKKRLGKYEYRSGSALFESVYRSKQSQDQLSMHAFKQQIKQNLFVKQFIPKPKLKQNLNEVISKNLISSQIRNNHIKQVKQMQNQMKHRKIFFTQLSSSMNLNDDISLNEIKNHYVEVRPQKKSKYYQIVVPQALKNNQNSPFNGFSVSKNLQSKSSTMSIESNMQFGADDHYKLPALKKNFSKKQSPYWDRLITSMKENKFRYMEKFPPIDMKQYLKKNDYETDFNRKYKIKSARNEVLTQQMLNNMLKQKQNQLTLEKPIKTAEKIYQKECKQQRVEDLVLKNEHVSEHLKNMKKIKQQEFYKSWKKSTNIKSYANYEQDQMQTKKMLKKGKQNKVKQLKEKFQRFQKQCLERRQ